MRFAVQRGGGVVGYLGYGGRILTKNMALAIDIARFVRRP